MTTPSTPQHLHRPRGPLPQAKVVAIAQKNGTAKRDAPITLNKAPWEDEE